MKNYSLYFIFAFILMNSCKENSKQLINIKASVQQNDELKENPLLMHPMTSSIQPKESTMSTLYGNDEAFQYAQKNFNSAYPQNAILYEVTWKQKADELWFGANVPKEIESVEKITFGNNNEAVYEIFQGKPLKKIKKDVAFENTRKELITSQKMAVSP
ncbi:hypothetical protein SAMN05443633_11552 [Chryseobacterium arachidis]|uniref:Uncharacterized protein n=1 Tax=Chryseobacterium arachidis TaxID=1416778 RepID=A0A1M5JQ54_9FLAO|nr:hypothetical protein [Chryseobacterium arachidis]SHG42671.1 hypothetical protein SAMN05443633_11552 [Chryseobacterium arachidis]